MTLGLILITWSRPLGSRAEAWHRRASAFGGPARVYTWGFRLLGSAFIAVSALALAGLIRFRS